MGIGRAVQFMWRIKPLAVGSRAHEPASWYSALRAPCGLGASIGQQPNEDDVTNAVLFFNCRSRSVFANPLGPVLFDDYVAVPRGVIWMPFTAPFASGKLWRDMMAR